MVQRLCLVALLLLGGFLRGRMEAAYRLPWPRLGELILRDFELQDFSFVAAGFRRLAADAAWVQMLLYLGGVLPEDNSGKDFGRLHDLTLRVARLDPYFHRPYVFGAGLLAWGRTTGRYDEALDILRDGLRFSPDYWPFYANIAAIGYKQRGEFSKMSGELQKAASHPECPVLIKSILANSYKAQGRYREALAVWLAVLDNPREQADHARARREAEWLAARLRAKPSKR